MRILSFLGWPIIAGILAAALILQLYPQLLTSTPTVEIRQANNERNSTQGPFSYADAVDRAAPAVVNIYTRTLVDSDGNPIGNDPLYKHYFNSETPPTQERIHSSLGSGVIINPQGYVVTNNHVIAGADSIIVALQDGREAVAQTVGTDPETDIAVLKISLGDLPDITLAPTESLRVGDVVLAIGNPFGVGQTVTQGIISATDRNSLGLNTYEDFIQTDAAINPGNSGGALIDPNGNLVGINTAIFSKSGGSEGIGFAIPVDLVKQVLEDLIERGRVVRGWVGVEAQPLNPRLAESFGLSPEQHGLIIAGIYRDSPAHTAGLQPGDVLLALDEQPITDDGHTTMNTIARLKPGEKVRFTIYRNGAQQEIEVTTTERPANVN
ncbi:Outer membrane stress sensor protease DegS [Marinobacterium lacunae]|uniref:Outer membrane stress sensor protease DegS n=1 Tax=Marinobacterium lacunae TaxID=1232683 RepID=A0A081FXJ3_9GAMM|nr:trypsin-like peptidase domain-containing protein [Marinobacterium lacunae]KEA63248.1 Outer membrane stress sensor protease DegS [Marinobacterium lacunae]MBR9882762.1 trypsin-like serine protease [Oceanospirillales bacterium]